MLLVLGSALFLLQCFAPKYLGYAANYLTLGAARCIVSIKALGAVNSAFVAGLKKSLIAVSALRLAVNLPTIALLHLYESTLFLVLVGHAT